MSKYFGMVLIAFTLNSCCLNKECCDDCPEPCNGVRLGFVSVPDSFYTYYPFTQDSSFRLNEENDTVTYLSTGVVKDSIINNQCDSFYTIQNIYKIFVADKTGLRILYSWSNKNQLRIAIGKYVFYLDSMKNNTIKYYSEVKLSNGMKLYDCFQIYNDWDIKTLYYSKSKGILAFYDNTFLWRKIN